MGTQGEVNGHQNHPDEREPFFSAFEGTSVERPGTQIGRFKLLSVLGEGGYGIVYLAEQQRPMRRRVALKIIKPGMDSKEVLARFESERQALALLDHAHIAQVFTSGATDAGRPYFVMEYVDGLPVTEYCDQHQLNIDDRLRLFQQVCEAVRHAHQKGIIHRDLKPSNILVTTQNDCPVAKIIDFGVARATSQPLTDRTLYTERGQMVGTPEYMSPEQADMAFEGIDTRSDVYSLGAVLYELLTGTLPFDPETLRQGGAEGMRKTIRDQEPFTPSTRLSSLGDNGKEIAVKRSTELSALTKQLHTELEWIPLKALRKDRTRRYQSAAEFGQDIQNYLNGDVLIAGPESMSYKLNKFVRRHKTAFISAIAIVGLLAVGFVVSSSLYVVAKQAQKSAEDRAESLRHANYGHRIALAEVAHRVGHKGRVDQLLALCPEDLRGWEWDWLSYTADESLVTLMGYPKNKHVKQITSIVLSPDNKRIYVAGVKGGIQVWDLDSGSEVMTLFVGDWIWSIAVDPAGERLVTGTMGGTIQLWDTLAGEEIMTLKKGYSEPYSGDGNDVFSVAFSPDGNKIVSAGKTIQVWDAATGEVLMILKGHTDKVRDVVFSPNNRRIASGSFDKTVKVWDAETGFEIMTFEAHKEQVICLAFSPDGKQIVSGSNDRTIGLWNAETGENIRFLYGHTGASIWSVSFSPDGKRIVSGGSDGTVRVWNATNGAEMSTLNGHASDVTSALFSSDGKRVISGSYDLCVKVWNPSINRERTVLKGHSGSVLSISFSPDGNRLASGSRDGLVKIWDVASACEVKTLYGHKGAVQCVSYSPDGKTIVSASTDMNVKLWDAATGNEIMTLSEHDSSVNCVAFSPDGNRIISGSDDKTIRCWDVATGNTLMTLIEHEAGVSSVGFSLHGEKIISAGKDGLAKIWDSASGNELMSIRVQESSEYNKATATVMKDDKHIITGGKWVQENGARMWDLRTGEAMMSLKSVHMLQAIAITPDLKRIVTADQGIVAFWEGQTGTEVLTLKSNERYVLSLEVSSDGKTIGSGNENGTICLLESEAPTGGYEPRINAENARILVDRLHTECGSYTQVLQKLETDTSLGESVHKFSLQIARSRLGQDSFELVE